MVWFQGRFSFLRLFHDEPAIRVPGVDGNHDPSSAPSTAEGKQHLHTTKDYVKVSICEPDDSHSVDPMSGDNASASTSLSPQRGLTSYFTTEFRNLVTAWLSMCLAVISGSSIGPVFKYMSTHGIHAMQSASWRCQCMLIWLGPLAIVEMMKESSHVTWFDIRPGLRYPVYVHVILAGVFWAGNLLTWIVGLKYTTTGQPSE